jgi:hypothetical protein
VLKEAELAHWFQRLAIPEQGRAAIHQVRSSIQRDELAAGVET